MNIDYQRISAGIIIFFLSCFLLVQVCIFSNLVGEQQQQQQLVEDYHQQEQQQHWGGGRPWQPYKPQGQEEKENEEEKEEGRQDHYLFHNNHDKHKLNVREEMFRNKVVAAGGGNADEVVAQSVAQSASQSVAQAVAQAVARGEDFELKRKQLVQYYIENPRVVIVITIDSKTKRPILKSVDKTVRNIFDTIYKKTKTNTDMDTNMDTNMDPSNSNGDSDMRQGHNRILTFLFLFADDEDEFKTEDGEQIDLSILRSCINDYKKMSVVQPDDTQSRTEIIQLKRKLVVSASSGGVSVVTGGGVSGGSDNGEDSGPVRRHDRDPNGSKAYKEQPGMNALQRASINAKVQKLVERMEINGQKSIYEDITLLFIKPGAEILTEGWLDVVTNGLRGSAVPLHKGDNNAGVDVDTNVDDANTVIINPANAISFALDGSPHGESYSLNYRTQIKRKHKLLRRTSDAQDQENQQLSYPTALVEGTATAMKLQTYMNFPMRDPLLDSYLAVDLEMSYNLWLCGDGIDILPQLVVKAPELSHAAKHQQDEEKKTTVQVKEEVKRQYGLAEIFTKGKKFKLNSKDKDAVGLARTLQAWAIKDHHSIESKEKKEVVANTVSEVYHFDKVNFLQLLAVMEKKSFPLPSSNDYCRDFAWYNSMIVNEIDGGGQKDGKIDRTEVKSESKRGEVKDEEPRVQLSGSKRVMMSKVVPIDLEYDGAPRGEPVQVAPEDTKEETKVENEEENEKETEKLRHRKRRAKRRAFRKTTPGFTQVQAIGEDGTKGYVHDATSLRRNPPEFNFINKDDYCSIRDETWKLLTEKVSIDFEGHEAAEKKALSDKKDRIKLLCVVYTIEYNHARIQPIRETWGKSCNGFVVASNKTDLALDIVNIPHEGAEEYSEVWHKVQAVWSYVYDNYYNDYDWFHIGGDDMYVLVENLRLYLESDEIRLASNGGLHLPTGTEKLQYPLSLGRHFKDFSEIHFNSGGPGYTINKAALKTVVTKIGYQIKSFRSSAEDLYFHKALQAIAGLYPYDTRDEEGGERYHHFKPETLYNFHVAEHDQTKDWYSAFSVNPVKEGLDSCARRSVSFHYIDSELMRYMYALLNGYCRDAYVNDRMLIP